MKAGRELDALVAEKVMGWEIGAYGGLSNISPNESKWSREKDLMEGVPYYSTDMSAAWEVVEKITGDDWVALIITCRPKQADAGECWKSNDRYWAESVYGGQDARRGPAVNSNSLPHAICLIALKILEETQGPYPG